MRASILIVDDEESIRFTFERFLTSEGYIVATASSCKEALDRINEGGIELIFADFNLPDGTGIDILHELNLRKDKCQVIIMTAYPSVETARETLLMGSCGYILKPLRQEDVIQSAKAAMQYKPLSMTLNTIGK